MKFYLIALALLLLPGCKLTRQNSVEQMPAYTPTPAAETTSAPEWKTSRR